MNEEILLFTDRASIYQSKFSDEDNSLMNQVSFIMGHDKVARNKQLTFLPRLILWTLEAKKEYSSICMIHKFRRASISLIRLYCTYFKAAIAATE